MNILIFQFLIGCVLSRYTWAAQPVNFGPPYKFVYNESFYYDSKNVERIAVSNNTLLRLAIYRECYRILEISTIDARDKRNVCVVPLGNSEQIALVTSLGNNKLYFGVKPNNKNYIWYNYVVNLAACTYSKTESFGYTYHDFDGWVVFPFHDSYELLRYENSYESKAWRKYFAANGTMLRDTENPSQCSAPIEHFWVGCSYNRFDNYNATRKYFTLTKFQNASFHYLMRIGVLNEHFTRVTELDVEYTIDAYSTAHNNFSTCTRLVGNRLVCRQMDYNFNLKSCVHQIIDFVSPTGAVAMHNLFGGGLIVAYESSRIRNKPQVFLARFDNNGRIVSHYSLEINEFTSLRDLIITEKDRFRREYCVVAVSSDRADLKCVKL